MVKNRFYKNLYQSISFLLIIIIFVFLLIIGFILSLNYENSDGWILLVIAASLLTLYFVIGFYWIFQKVTINEEGIEICFCKQIIRKYVWNEISSVEEANIMKNPALRIKIFNGSEIHLDKRKSVVSAIEYYSKSKWHLTMNTNDELNFLIKLASFLGSDFDNQENKLGLLGDCLTDDIANDWDWDYLKFYVNDLVQEKIISKKLEAKFILIDKNFGEVSRGGKFYNPDIWTLTSLKESPFWEKQRALANEILKELENIIIK